jgi:hypothetical protein
VESSVLGIDVLTGKPVTIPEESRAQGLYVIGKYGTGKSTLLENLILSDIDQGVGLCVLDPRGDLVNDVLSGLTPALTQSVYVLDVLDSSYPFGLNIYECLNPNDPLEVASTISNVMQVLQKMWEAGTEQSSWGMHMEELLRNTAFAMVAKQGMTLAEVPKFLVDSAFRQHLLRKLTNQQVRSFWEYEYNLLKADEQSDYRRTTVKKVRSFISIPLVENIVGQSKTTINFRELMDGGRALLVKLATRFEDLTTLVGAMMVGGMLRAAFSREDIEPTKRRPFHLYVDDYQRFAIPDFAVLFSEAGKFGTATTIAHQSRAELDAKNRAAALNAGDLIAFAVSRTDAKELAHEVDWTAPPPAIVRWKPKLRINRDPLHYLVNIGHEQLPDAARNWLRLLVDARADLNPFHSDDMCISYSKPHGVGRWWDKKYGYGYYTNLDEGIRLINQFLVWVMEQGVKADGFTFTVTEDVKERYLKPIFTSLRGWLGIEPDAEALLMIKPGVRDRDWEVFKVPPSKKFVTLLDRYILSDTEGDEPEEIKVAGIFKRNLVSIARRLALWPIMEESGEYEPEYEKPKAYTDMEQEITYRLTNLPQYQAHARIRVQNRYVEYTIQTIKPDLGKLPEAVKHEIIAKSRAAYCRKREEVEREIRERQMREGASA